MSNNAIQIAGSPSHIFCAWRALKSSAAATVKKSVEQSSQRSGKTKSD